MSRRPDDARVAITGAGCVTVLGDGPDALVDALLAGRSGISRWRRHPPGLLSRIGGDLSGFDLESHLAGWPAELAARARQVLRLSGPAGRHVAVAARQALAQAGLGGGDERTAHVLGAHNVNEQLVFDQAHEFRAEPEYVDPMYGVVAFDTDLLAATNEIFGILGPSLTVGGACASSNAALVVGLDLLRCGRADRVLVTGTAMTTSPLALQGWAFIEALTLDTFADEPARASRPFDVRREGFVPAEGAGAVVLERWDAARARGAEPLGELCGGAVTSAASRGTRTDIDAQARAIRDALRDARVTPEEVGYVNAHGTSTPLGDGNELAALRVALGDHALRVPINASKSMLGHALQGASILELVATLGQLRRGRLHATLNLDDVDPELAAFDLVRGAPRETDARVALSDAFGFGGVNAVVVVAV